MFSTSFRLLLVSICVLSCVLNGQPSAAADPEPIRILFLGDNGHHRPADRAAQLTPVLWGRGIQMQYTDDPNDLDPETLAKFDGLMIYANIEKITPEQERALLDYVAGGKGFIPVHCASFCFLNSPKYVELVGAQFRRHTTGTVRPEIAEPNHPIMKGFNGFESWDETYQHHRHNEANRTVLSYRLGDPQAEGQQKEPWTWVRTHGKGRVFYTAWGHDQRTWGHPGFHNLIERGIRWAVGDDSTVVPEYRDPNLAANEFPVPEMTAPRTDVQPFEYVDVGSKIPNYTPGERWGTQGEPFSKMQKPLSPDESLKHYVTPVGFELKLFASEPDLAGKPIAMTWDERGRLWVAETYDYPNELQPPGEGRDRIRICEDTDGDGRADKFTVFAEKLSIPTSITFSHGGAIVQSGTETLYLKDIDGDDRADVRRVLISGWAMGDTHGGVSNFQYGLDNWIWAMQGYNNSEPVIDGRRQQSFRQGFFRFRIGPSSDSPGRLERIPHVSELEFLRSTNNNTWGLGISEEGIIFGSTANRNPSVYMPIPNRYYERVRGWSPEQLGTIADTHLFKPITKNVRQVDHHGGYTAGAGHALYTARRYPQAFWNRTAFVCGPTGHLVGTFVLQPDGADFHSTSPCNLVASDDEWAAPIMAEVGPDGNVWILDWYNYIVQHNPTPIGFRTGKGNAYETDLRDKRHGRVYRLVYKDPQSGVAGAGPKGSPGAKAIGSTTNGASQSLQPRPPTLSLANAPPEQLVETLKHPTMLWRKHAQRLLVERGQTDVVPALLRLVADQSVDAIGLNVGAIHALWALHGLGVLDGSHAEALNAAFAALKHPSAGVRRNAVMVLPPQRDSVAAILEAGVLNDADAQVRLAAILALADLPADERSAQAVSDLMIRSDVQSDRWLADALTSAAAQNATGVLPMLAKQTLNRRALEIVSIISEHVARGKPSADELQPVLVAIGQSNSSSAEAVLAGLGNGWPKDHTISISREAEQALVSLLEQVPDGTKGELIRLGMLWGSKALEKQASQILARLGQTMKNPRATDAQRIDAARQLVALRPQQSEAVVDVLDTITPQASPELAAGLIEALGQSTAENVGRELVRRSQAMTPALRAAALRVLLARPETTRSLLDGIDTGDVLLSDLSLDQKQALMSHPNRFIRQRVTRLLERGGGLPDPDRDKVLQDLLPLTKKTGDAGLGKAVFVKQCSKCHTHSGEGQQIGPDLTGMAVHPKAELLTHMIDPSRSVEGNFRTYTVLTTDGRVLNGMLAGETKTSLELIDTEAKRHAIPRDDIEEIVASKKSLMPDGFEKQVSTEDIVNLLEFLTQRGKYTPLDLRKVATIVSTRGMFYDENSSVERLVFSDWSPKTFEGVPFVLVDPQGDRVPNVVLLHGPQGKFPPQMPRSVSLLVNQPAKAIHLLSGVAGWAAQGPLENGSVSMIVRLHYADGQTEDHELRNGRHFADYIGPFEVPESKLAFRLRRQQIRYLAIEPQRTEPIARIEFIKGPDRTAPIVMAVTVEGPMSE